MNFIPFLFKKDLMRFKYLHLVWLLLILAQSALGVGGHRLASEIFEFQMFLPLLIRMIGFLQGLMIIIIVPLIIQDDSVVGTTAFWYTRPISRKALLVTKSFTILILLVIPPLAAELFVLAANGASAYHLLLAVPEVLIEKLAFIVPFVILAALTPKFSRYALVGVIIFATLVVFAIIKSVIPMFLPKLGKYLHNFELYNNPSLEASISVVKDIYVFLFGSVLIIHQFLTRYTAKTIKWLSFAFLVMLCFTRLWNWDFLKEVTVVTSSPAISESLSVHFDTQYLIISDEFRHRKEDVREKSISTRQRLKGLPAGQFAILRRMKDVQMKYPDGTVLESQYTSTVKKETFSSEKFMRPIQAVLKDVKLLNPFKEKFSYTEIFSLDESALHQYKERTGTYSACADFDIYKYEIVSQVSLKQGLRDSFGSEQVSIYDILERPNVISVVINEKKINLLFDRRVKRKSQYDRSRDIYSDYNHIYLLVNNQRHEAFLPEVEGNVYANVMAAFAPSRLETLAKQFHFADLNDRSGLLPKLDKEWLADAELVRIDAVKTGTEKIDFTIEGFSLPTQSTSTSEEIDELEQQLRMQDKKVRKMLPESLIEQEQ